MKNKKTFTWIIIISVLIGGIVLAYLLTRKFLSDRQRMMTSNTIRREFRQIPNTTTKRNYTQKEIEEMKKKGTLPNNLKQPYMPPNQAGDAAVQQSLRTIQEINKINEMNQRLMDQQRRTQDQSQRR